MKRSLLIVLPAAPYPPRQSGVSIRYTPILNHLAKTNDVHIAVITKNPPPPEHVQELLEHCSTVRIHKRESITPSLFKRAFTRVMTLLPWTAPHTMHCYDELEIEHFLREIAADDYHAIIWVSSFYIDMGLRIFDRSKIVLDAVDSAYLLHIRGGYSGVFHHLDGWKLLKWERRITDQVRLTTYASPVDVKSIVRNDSSRTRIAVVPNGIYLDDHTTSRGVRRQSSKITLGFLGNMGYPPNARAAMRLVRILERVLARDPNFHLCIIGRDPAQVIRDLASDNITVTGTVNNIWPHLDTVDYFVFPMLSGAGQQNKVLEAMYAGKVVVCNEMANGGIGGIAGQHLEICETDDDFVDALLALKNDPARARRLAHNGRAFVSENYSWEAIFPKLDALFGIAS